TMKRTIISSRLTVLLGRACYGIMMVAAAVAIMGLTQTAQSGIQGSAHDFSAIDDQQRICIFCHTPHNADTTVVDAPLWNHAVTNKTFQLYNSPTFDAVPGQPQGASRLCLSCHDGTVAVDSYGGQT